jgi:GxxExxY protein
MALDDQEQSEQRVPSQLLHRELTGKILGSFYSVYGELGGGFVEAVYERALAKELTRLSLKVDCQVPITVSYKNRPVGLFRADILVDHLVLLELKARPAIEPAHESQLLNCLRATPIEVGLLLNFGPEPRFKRFVFSNRRKKTSMSRRH